MDGQVDDLITASSHAFLRGFGSFDEQVKEQLLGRCR